MALTDTAHQLIIDHFSTHRLSDQTAIDATCGNGHDTLFLAKLGFKAVYGFDIQQQAIDNTQQLIQQERLDNVTLIRASHDTMDHHVHNKVDCILFNLGYLPNANKQITTLEHTSLKALTLSLERLSPTGLISILCYPGHPEGKNETKAIQGWLPTLDKKWQVKEVLATHPSARAPVLYVVTNRCS